MKLTKVGWWLHSSVVSWKGMVGLMTAQSLKHVMPFNPCPAFCETKALDQSWS